MKSRIAKTFVAIAATFAATGAWADDINWNDTSSSANLTFDSANNNIFGASVDMSSTYYAVVGKSDAETFADGNWCVWKTSDGSDDYGIADAKKRDFGHRCGSVSCPRKALLR